MLNENQNIIFRCNSLNNALYIYGIIEKAAGEEMREKDDMRFVHENTSQLFLLKKDTYAFTHTSKILGLIKDISTDGMTVQYVVLDERQPIDIIFDLVDIFMIGGHFIVRQAPCEIIYDQRHPEEVFASWLLEIRRMGIHFGRLSADQRTGIITLIEACATKANPENSKLVSIRK